MGILKKLMFWKTDDEFDDMGDSPGMSPDPLNPDQPLEKSPFDQPAADPLDTAPAMPPAQPAMPQQPTAPMSTGQPQAVTARNPDLELISTKLDTIKVMLNSIDQRIANLEKISGTGQKEKLW